MRYEWYRWRWAALDWLFPPTCGGCEMPGERWCRDCQVKIAPVAPPFCERCGQTTSGGGLCDRCISSPPKMTAIRSWAVFDGPIREAMHRVKYRRDVALAEALSRPLVGYVRDLNWHLDIIVPVPLSAKRMKERGYNQAALLAKPLALGLGLKYCDKALSRGRDTRSQVGLSLDQRRQNVHGAFSASKSMVSGKAVLVVDDVATSGSTLDSCAEALWHTGAENVYGMTLARAVLSSK
ncbi:MAG: ComF family protein [Chloroflexi bacterium]|nr:ComF family protein [Chloroflexota bacterium]